MGLTWPARLSKLRRSTNDPLSQWTGNQINAGAKALHQHEMAGRRLDDWASLPEITRDRWRVKAVVVLNAALLGPTDEKETVGGEP